MSTTPARLLGVKGGTITVGSPADIVIFDPCEQYTVDPASFKSKSRNTPFAGRRLTGRVRYTILNGEISYKADK